MGLVTSTLGWTIRSLQIVDAFLLVALGSWGLDQYSQSGALGFSVAVGSFSFAYLLFIIFFGIFIPRFIVAGFLVAFEALFALLYFVAFIVVSDVFLDDVCNATGVDTGACRGTKSVIAWSAVNFVLFTVSTVLVVFATILPILLSRGGEGLWQSEDGLFHSHALTIDYTPVPGTYKKNDIEANKTAADYEEPAATGGVSYANPEDGHNRV